MLTYESTALLAPSDPAEAAAAGSLHPLRTGEYAFQPFAPRARAQGLHLFCTFAQPRTTSDNTSKGTEPIFSTTS